MSSEKLERLKQQQNWLEKKLTVAKHKENQLERKLKKLTRNQRTHRLWVQS